MSIIQGTSKAAGGGYEIDQSIRFNKTTSSHLSKTYGSAGNRRTWTFSTWFKRGKIDGTRQSLFAATGTAYLQVGPDAASREMITLINEGSGTNLNWYTTAVYRDPSAWYHLVWQFDSTQATADNRTKLYINGSQVTDFTKAATPSLNLEGAINNAVEHKIGEIHIANYYFDGLQSEIHFINGTALDASSFGEYNEDGVWIPKAYTGSYGSTGFHITGATDSDLGEDFSGNGNDFTSSGGLATTDQMLDTPTVNYATLNTLDKGSTVTLSDGGLVYGTTGGANNGVRGSIGLTTGKWYWEVLITASVAARTAYVGFGSAAANLARGNAPTDGSYYGYRTYTGNKDHTTSSAYGDPFSINETVGIALNLDDGEVTFYNEGISQGVAFTGIDLDTTWFPMIYVNDTIANLATFNFGQSAFSYTPPTGFNTLNTSNLPSPSITDGSAHFQPTLYTGDSSTNNTITGVGFEPDFVWLKARTLGTGGNHVLVDSVRGDGNAPSTTKELYSSLTNAESSTNIIGFNSDGFRLLSTGSGDQRFNQSGQSYVAWCWKANGSGSSNTDGSINTTATSVNTTAGFSISTYTGNATVGATVGHGLGIAPKVVIVKSRSNGESWVFGHDSVGWTKAMYMQSTGAPFTLDIYWNNTAPTSSVVELHDHPVTNGNSYTYVMYAFAEIPGYSSFGSYTGNGSATNGPFIYTNGMTPKYVMIKRTNSTGYWDILDTTREPFNSVGNQLFANTSAAEASNDHEMDFVSNGIKIRDTSTSVNASGSTYIYMAFGSPFGGDGVAPATAR